MPLASGKGLGIPFADDNNGAAPPPVGNVTVFPTGIGMTCSGGTVTVIAKAIVSPTGMAATSASGSVTVTNMVIVALTGNQATCSAGNVTVTTSGTTNVPVTGEQANSAINDVSVIGKAAVNLSGVAATSANGSVTVTAVGNVSTNLTGAAATSAAGTVSIAFGTKVNVTGNAATSANGSVTVTTGGVPATVWTSRTITGDLKAIDFGAGLFVAVGTNICRTSPDGVTWTTRTIGTGDWAFVTWDGVNFLASSDVSTATRSSSDGITWAAATTVTSSVVSQSAGNGLHIASYGGAQRSTNGAAWTALAALPSSGSTWLVSWLSGAGRWCAPDDGGSGAIYWSNNDGTSWSTGVTNVGGSEFYETACSNGTTLCLSDWATGKIRRTTDCSTLTTSITTSFTSIPKFAVVGNGTFVFGATNSSSVYTSPDGTTFTLRSAVLPASAYRGIAYGAGVFCVIGNAICATAPG